MKWDGSELKGFDKSMFIVKFPSPNNPGINYCKFKYNNEIICCKYNRMKDISPCIYDEFMSLFNTRKNGTHYVLIKKYYYIFFKINYDYKINKLKEDKILSSIIYDKKMNLNKNTKECIRKMYVLRDLLGIITSDGHISIRNIRNTDQVIAHKVPVISHDKYTSNECTISDCALKVWFGDDDDINIIMLNICPVNNHSYLPYISNIKRKMENIVKRIDKNYIYMVDIIISRMRDRLEIALD
uniref:Uncharacterized protein n=1 Tax=Pithovirus LCPAC101 TaxID=2506586 RepID=A0A481Z496_9VIRU|nr:MAG: uncharacterized protein LCPAC101_01510 [Pithovirus LCPAC101]